MENSLGFTLNITGVRIEDDSPFLSWFLRFCSAKSDGSWSYWNIEDSN